MEHYAVSEESSRFNPQLLELFIGLFAHRFLTTRAANTMTPSARFAGHILIMVGLMLSITHAHRTLPRDTIVASHTSLAVELNSTVAKALKLAFHCPPDTGYVFDALYTTRPFLGCAPVGHKPCVDLTSRAILGACPSNGSCCFFGGRFGGCASTADQCCYNTICPDGYTCCGTAEDHQCCPLDTGELVPDANTTYCKARTAGSTPTLCADATYASLPFCPISVDPALCNSTAIPGVCNSLTRCGQASDCRYANETLKPGVVSLPSGNTTTYARDPDIASALFCCPATSDLCFDDVTDDSDHFIGCADPAKNETCCGAQICSAGYKCCDVTTTQFAYKDTGRFDRTKPVLNVTRGARCCPISADCCTAGNDMGPYPLKYGAPLSEVDPSNPPSPLAPFCGMTVSVNYTDPVPGGIATIVCHRDIETHPRVSFLRALFRSGVDEDGSGGP